MWVFAILVVLAIGAIAVVAAGRGTPLQEEYDDRPDAFVPAADPLGPGDLKSVRFSLAVRGYRMSEVDALLSRLAKQLEEATGEPAPRALPAPEAAVDLAPEPTPEPAPEATAEAAPEPPADRDATGEPVEGERP